jgi:hypothetical protein
VWSCVSGCPGQGSTRRDRRPSRSLLHRRCVNTGPAAVAGRRHATVGPSRQLGSGQSSDGMGGAVIPRRALRHANAAAIWTTSCSRAAKPFSNGVLTQPSTSARASASAGDGARASRGRCPRSGWEGADQTNRSWAGMSRASARPAPDRPARSSAVQARPRRARVSDIPDAPTAPADGGRQRLSKLPWRPAPAAKRAAPAPVSPEATTSSPRRVSLRRAAGRSSVHCS